MILHSWWNLLKETLFIFVLMKIWLLKFGQTIKVFLYTYKLISYFSVQQWQHNWDEELKHECPLCTRPLRVFACLRCCCFQKPSEEWFPSWHDAMIYSTSPVHTLNLPVSEIWLGNHQVLTLRVFFSGPSKQRKLAHALVAFRKLWTRSTIQTF